MAAIEKIDELNLYQNPTPAIRSRQATFPGVAQLPNGELLALFSIGEAFEAANGRMYVSRSKDKGHSWEFEGLLYDQEGMGLEFQYSDSMKPLLLQNGTVIAAGYGFERRDPDKGIGDEETKGFPPGWNMICFSEDLGRTWTNPVDMAHGDDGMLELSGPTIQLRSGRILGAAPPFNTKATGQKGLIIASDDNGKTWRKLSVYYQSPQGNVAPWETRICEMQPDRVVGIIWAFDTATDQHLTNKVMVSHDGGSSWSEPIDTGHMGQASNLMWLGGERLMSIHSHRAGEVGLYVRVVDFAGDQWNVQAESVIWGKAAAQDPETGIIEQFANLKFGQPSLLQLADGEILATHWCVEDGLYVIKTHRLKVSL